MESDQSENMETVARNSIKEVEESDKSAYEENFKAHRPGISLQETIKCYDEWAKKGKYDQDVPLERYRGPVIAADTVNEWVKDKEARILDVAAGTGFVGFYMKERGFVTIDALEPSKEMLDIAEEKNIYKNHICAAISDQKTNIPDDSYDAVVIAGGMGEGHIPSIGMKELIRVTKKGGLVINVMRKEYMTYVSDYKGRFLPFLSKLENMKYWKKEQEKTVEKYSFNKKDGVVFVFKVLIEGFPEYDTIQVDSL